ncbi:MAG: dihydroneopterin aldolase [Flavobacteriales bacterium]|nr:dihydroneopterin aldolase [Flavobacteriales bacterium]
MGLIEVKGIRVFAFHGCLPEEERIGGQYRVDVCVNGDFLAAEDSDRLNDTIDYGRVTDLVREQMAVRSKLIEHVAGRILSSLKAEWPGRGTWTVCVVKERPPVRGDVDEAVYTAVG